MTSQLWSIWCPVDFYLLPISFLIYNREFCLHREHWIDIFTLWGYDEHSDFHHSYDQSNDMRGSQLSTTLLLVSFRFTDSPVHLVNSGKDRRSNMHSSNASAASPVFPKGRLSVLVCLERRKRMIPPGNIIIITSLNICTRALTHPKKLSCGSL